MSASYSSAGINLNQMEILKDTFKAFGNLTNTEHVINNAGSFAGLYKLPSFQNPILVAGTDGVGTKLKISAAMGHYESLGKDLVVLNANDILCKGAQPLFFLNYIAFSKFNQHMLESLMKGMVWACKSLDCSLISGETANMPGVYEDNEFDLAGFIVGAVEENELIHAQDVTAGDSVYALSSNGIHTNGYSLVRQVFDLDSDTAPLFQYMDELQHTLGEELLQPHRNYYPILKDSFNIIKGLAHITGGGMPGKIKSVLPAGHGIIIDRKSWNIPAIFNMIQRKGNVTDAEMFNVFNMGIGMVIVIDPSNEHLIEKAIPESFKIGNIIPIESGSQQPVQFR